MLCRFRLPILAAAVAAVIFTAICSVPARATSNPMLPLAKVATITLVEQNNIRHLYSTSSRVRLTFDDCASQIWLTSELEFLLAHNIEAIFFFTGQCMRQHPTYSAQIISAGQLLGNHSYDHKPYLTLTSDQIYAEIRQTFSVIPSINQNVVRLRRSKLVIRTNLPKLCRPPYGNGAYSVRVYNEIAVAGCRPATWTVDTLDWTRSSTVASIIRIIRDGTRSAPPLMAGGVILMHGTGHYTRAAQQGIIDVIRDKHLLTFTIS